MKVNGQEISVWLLVFGTVMFLILSVFGFFLFYVGMSDLVIGFQQNNEVIYFDKGAMYGLGVGISLFVFFIVVIHEGILQRSLSEKKAVIFTRIMIVGLVISFILPQVAYFVVSEIIDDIHYLECDVPTNAWPVYKTLVYTDTEQTCLRLIEEKKQR